MASGKPPYELTVEQQAIQAVAKAVRAEVDGKQLRKDLIAEMRSAIEPGVSAVQAKLRAVPSHGAADPSPALGTYLAGRVKSQVRLSGRATGVRIRIGRTDKLRGFTWAARRLNRTHWRHKVFGRDVWVEQHSPIPGYFDSTFAGQRKAYRDAVMEAVERLARRIAERAR